MIMKLLQTINTPADLKQLSVKQLEQLAAELRHFIIDEVSANPGHLGASLGTIELTLAVHYVFDSPHDKIIWDVGHQAYAHKIITGRRKQFHTNRKINGLSGFPVMAESPHDAFGTGHSSTSISAGLGMAIAAELKQTNSHVIAIIGDGALTGGMAFEALNNLGVKQNKLLVILNDNNMSIDPNVGAIDQTLPEHENIAHLEQIGTIKTLIEKLKQANNASQKDLDSLQFAIEPLLHKPGNFFEALNINYSGPINGHNIERLVKQLQKIKHRQGAQLLHCITLKGKGYKPAEKDQIKWHAPGKFDKKTGLLLPKNENNKDIIRFQDIYGKTLLQLAENNPNIVAITPAMPTGSSLNHMLERFPERVFDVGIAEQHAVTFSAGLATQGFVPFCTIYSTFLQRAYDQIIHDVALQNIPVIFAIDRAGIVGADGATHHGYFDLAFLRSIPNMIVAAPIDAADLRNLMYTAQSNIGQPFAFRFPRGNAFCEHWQTAFETIPIGKARKICDGTKMAILTIGTVGQNARQAINLHPQKHQIALIDMRFLKPIDQDMLHQVASRFDTLITVEDGIKKGGLYSAVAEFLVEFQYHNQLIGLGMNDNFIAQGKTQELQARCGYDTQGIYNTIEQVLQNSAANKNLGSISNETK